MDLEVQIVEWGVRITFHDLDQGGIEVGSTERRGPLWLAVVGQDDPATTWEKTFDEWYKAGAAVCVEIARREDSKQGIACQ